MCNKKKWDGRNELLRSQNLGKPQLVEHPHSVRSSTNITFNILNKSEIKKWDGRNLNP